MAIYINGVKKVKKPKGSVAIGVEWNQAVDEWNRIDEQGNYIDMVTADFDRHPSWQLRRCTLAVDGTVNHYGSNPRGDGLTLDGTDGRVMVEIPKLYVKSLSPAANIYRWWISSEPKPGFELHPAFVQRGGIERDYIYTGAYEAGSSGAPVVLDSQTGDAVLFNQTIATFRTYAENIGARWGITNIWTMSAIQLLYFIEYANANSQSTIGSGITNTAGESNTGADSIDTNIAVNGTGSGTGVDSETPIAYRGIENLWGNILQFIDGYNTNPDNSEYQIARRDGLTIFVDDIDSIAGNYEGSVCAPLLDDAGYILNIEYEDLLRYLFIPSATDGSNTTYIPDYFDSHNLNETNILLYGGGWIWIEDAGIAFLSSDHVAATAEPFFGGRLEYV